jgi:hypothetical protein
MPYQHPQDDPNLKNLHYAMEYSGGLPAIRVTGGGGSGGAAGATEETLVEVKDAVIGLNYEMAYTYDEDDNLLTETRTLDGVSETRTYTWTAGNLTARSAWA